MQCNVMQLHCASTNAGLRCDPRRTLHCGRWRRSADAGGSQDCVEPRRERALVAPQLGDARAAAAPRNGSATSAPIPASQPPTTAAAMASSIVHDANTTVPYSALYVASVSGPGLVRAAMT